MTLNLCRRFGREELREVAFRALIESIPEVDIPAEYSIEIAVQIQGQAQPFAATPAHFGTMPSEDGLRSQFVAAEPLQAHTDLANRSALDGRIMVCERGGCSFAEKALRAEEAGCVGVVVIQNQEKWPHVMDDSSGKGDALGIPATMVSMVGAPGNPLRTASRTRRATL